MGLLGTTMVSKETTKVCKCGNENLVLLQTFNEKYCTVCQEYIPWYLEEGQVSPLTGMVGGLEEHLTPSKPQQVTL